MATDKQITANRQNAAKSTGPQSQSGKSRASRNALKHGLSAEQVVMFDEDPAVFDALRSDLFEHFQPADPVAGLRPLFTEGLRRAARDTLPPAAARSARRWIKRARGQSFFCRPGRRLPDRP